MQFVIPNLQKLDEKAMSLLLRAVKASVERWDQDDGWETATGTKRHRLGITPGWVIIQVSDDPKGATYEQINPILVTDTEITYTTAKAFVRVLAEK